MPVHAIIPATIISQRQPTESTCFVQDLPSAGPSTGERRTSYGTVHYADTSPSSPESHQERGGEDAGYLNHAVLFENGQQVYYDDNEEEDLDVTWKYMSRLYLLVPLMALLFLTALILLITFAWPPNERERKHGQTYPHAFLWKPLLIGIFASCTVQTIRVPIWVIFSWLGLSPTLTTYSSTVIHTLLHELIRLSTLPLTIPSPSSGFHSTYYLGLGWGAAEAVWGAVQGYEQLALYEDVFKPEDTDLDMNIPRWKVEDGDGGENGDLSNETIDEEELYRAGEREDEADLERKVEILERMRARRDLEEVIGVPFPSIPLALHILWRIDTILLNLGLTLILSAYYYDPIPIYRHPIPSHIPGKSPALGPNATPSPYLWLVWALVAILHVGVSVVWRIVGRVGVGAVTWGGLIVALGSVFAGLGCWGGLV